MTKLKTIDDLDYMEDGNTWIDKEKLKKEAIKWVKKARKFEDECVEREDYRTANFHGGYARGIMNFHNITEEDLK